ncbi:MAG: hypothetical protein MPN21_16090 [Thermoanaerobaculia bacterium]|nr:hypothetical protein [Thermoanaerobaculia bacterium]
MLFLLGTGATAASHIWQGPPTPRVVDELSYLYAAETFSRGRLTNPTPPHWRHFQAMHVLSEPTSQSKYPPAQAAGLAVGVALGHPALGLWLSSGLLTAAVAWLLSLWLPPPWPLLGALVVLLRIGVGSYWNQSYWGGTLAMVAGILVLGGVRVCLERPSVGGAVLLGLGLLTLANSRPFEGLLFSVPPCAVLAARLLRSKGIQARRRWLVVALPLAATLGLGAIAMGVYHHAVTGSALTFPHFLYTDRYMPGWAHFLWNYHFDRPLWQVSLQRGIPRSAFAAFFYLGLAGSCFAALALPRLRRDPWLAIGGLSAGLVLLGQFLTKPWHAHYSAPLGGVLVLTALIGLRRLTVGLRSQGHPGRLLPLAFLAAQFVICLIHLPAHRPDEDSIAGMRQTVHQRLVAEPGRDLVFLCNPWHRDDWMLNSPDLETAEVLWVRELTDDENQALLQDFADRRIWHLQHDQNGITLRERNHEGTVAFSAP